jgi:hypothetical protein
MPLWAKVAFIVCGYGLVLLCGIAMCDRAPLDPDDPAKPDEK